MNDIKKPIRVSGHAKEQLEFRGTTESEIIAAIREGTWQAAESDRLECRKDFAFEGEWNKKPYKKKQVRPIFVDEPEEIVVVTVYVYYF
jgi:hypothetical protein